MNFQKNYSLKNLNTFGINVEATAFSSFSTLKELDDCIKSRPVDDLLILGGGSNVLFTKKVEAAVLLNQLRGISLRREDEEYVWVKVGAGEVWHEFVLHCIKNNWCGVENLSLIPGSVGASPMQNIGAYGVEIKDVFHELEAYEIKTGKMHVFSAAECAFGYRESVFKRSLKNQFVITSVTFKLLKKPRLSTHYGAIQEQLQQMGVSHPTMRDVSNAVIAIRQSKLPNPSELGNAGSFFKNPVVPTEQALKLQQIAPAIPLYDVDDTHKKIAAGWLIEQTGWKGKVVGNCGVHKQQALVIVNYGGAQGNEIYQLSEQIVQNVFQKFGVLLEREVNIY